ncbi:hypothetical protein OAM56_07050 [Alphaproteobacteria bacterium]|nr:hypothetical protein [Alphaproteobacteria bacterium]
MSSLDTDRKIALIFATDVVGYSKHMEKDEDATLASLNADNIFKKPEHSYTKELISLIPKIESINQSC